MKQILNSSTITTLAVSILLLYTSDLFTQDFHKKDDPKFKIVIENTKDGIRMQGLFGTAWIDSAFSLAEGELQAIDEFGMTEIDEKEETETEELADFLITIEKSGRKIIMHGIKGTVWKGLSFTLRAGKSQAFTERGMESRL